MQQQTNSNPAQTAQRRQYRATKGVYDGEIEPAGVRGQEADVAAVAASAAKASAAKANAGGVPSMRDFQKHQQHQHQMYPMKIVSSPTTTATAISIGAVTSTTATSTTQDPYAHLMERDEDQQDDSSSSSSSSLQHMRRDLLDVDPTLLQFSPNARPSRGGTTNGGGGPGGRSKRQQDDDEYSHVVKLTPTTATATTATTGSTTNTTAGNSGTRDARVRPIIPRPQNEHLRSGSDATAPAGNTTFVARNMNSVGGVDERQQQHQDDDVDIDDPEPPIRRSSNDSSTQSDWDIQYMMPDLVPSMSSTNANDDNTANQQQQKQRSAAALSDVAVSPPRPQPTGAVTPSSPSRFVQPRQPPQQPPPQRQPQRQQGRATPSPPSDPPGALSPAAAAAAATAAAVHGGRYGGNNSKNRQQQIQLQQQQMQQESIAKKYPMAMLPVVTPSPRQRQQRGQQQQQRDLGVAVVDDDERDDDDDRVHLPDNVHVLHRLAMEHIANGEYDNALVAFSRVLQKQRKTHGDLHPTVASAFHNLGTVHAKRAAVLLQDSAQQRHVRAQALTCFQAAARTARDSLGRNHPNVAVSLVRIGFLLLQSRQYQNAIVTFREALRIRLAAYGGQHGLVANLYNNLGVCHMHLAQFQRGREYLDAALDIQRDVVEQQQRAAAGTTASSSSRNNAPTSSSTSTSVSAAKKGVWMHRLELADTLFNIGGLCLEWIRRQGPDARRAVDAEEAFAEALEVRIL